MTDSAPKDSTSSPSGTTRSRGSLRQLLLSLAFAGLSGLAFVELSQQLQGRSIFDPSGPDTFLPIPLVMQGGDPYIRALMRTISASESHDPRPYSLIYGGERIQSYSHHPDRCVRIVAGPNEGDCTTASGRYQFITTTWIKQAERYHPNPNGFLWWRNYGFSPEEQDAVVYQWLKDPTDWGVDLSALLQRGEIHEVLRILSPTWTSLGYGIETNSMSDYLPSIYQDMLAEELKTAGITTPPPALDRPLQPTPSATNPIQGVQEKVTNTVKDTINPVIQEKKERLEQKRQEIIDRFDRAIERGNAEP